MEIDKGQTRNPNVCCRRSMAGFLSCWHAIQIQLKELCISASKSFPCSEAVHRALLPKVVQVMGLCAANALFSSCGPGFYFVCCPSKLPVPHHLTCAATLTLILPLWFHAVEKELMCVSLLCNMEMLPLGIIQSVPTSKPVLTDSSNQGRDAQLHTTPGTLPRNLNNSFQRCPLR